MTWRHWPSVPRQRWPVPGSSWSRIGRGLSWPGTIWLRPSRSWRLSRRATAMALTTAWRSASSGRWSPSCGPICRRWSSRRCSCATAWRCCWARARNSIRAYCPRWTVSGYPSPVQACPRSCSRRPDIRASEERLLAANANLSVARAALYPSIQLTGNYGAQSSSLSDLLSNPLNTWGLAAGLTQPIFNAGRIRAQIDISEAVQQDALISYQRAILDALIDADTALGALQQARQQYQLQQEATAESELAFELAQARYRAGAITLQNLLDTQRSFFQSQDSLVQQRAAWLQATVNLYRALGGGWHETSDQVRQPG